MGASLVRNSIRPTGAQDITGTKTVKTGSKLVLEDAPVGATDAVNMAYANLKMAVQDGYTTPKKTSAAETLTGGDQNEHDYVTETTVAKSTFIKVKLTYDATSTNDRGVLVRLYIGSSAATVEVDHFSVLFDTSIGTDYWKWKTGCIMVPAGWKYKITYQYIKGTTGLKFTGNVFEVPLNG